MHSGPFSKLPNSLATFYGTNRKIWRTADAIIVPGGFAFGDYLRTGADRKIFSVMESVRRFAGGGGLCWELQWISDPLRIGAAARRAHAQRGTQICV